MAEETPTPSASPDPNQPDAEIIDLARHSEAARVDREGEVLDLDAEHRLVQEELAAGHEIPDAEARLAILAWLKADAQEELDDITSNHPSGHQRDK